MFKLRICTQKDTYLTRLIKRVR